VSWETVLPFVVLTLLASGLAIGVRAVAGAERFAKARPAIRVGGIAVIVVLVSLRMWG
jgi:hypothetical protein